MPRRALDQLAPAIGAELRGDGTREVSRLAPVFQAGPGELALLADPRYLEYVEGCRAEAILASSELADQVPPDRFAILVLEEPHRALPALLEIFHPPEPLPVEIHPTAVLGRGVRLGEGVSIGPYAVLEEGAVVGDGSRIGPHVTVGRRAEIGRDCVLHPQVVLYPDTKLGDRVILHAGARIGVDGFGYVSGPDGHRKVPQVGACVLEDDVEIGANTCIDRGSIGRTVVGGGTKVDNLVHLAHNVVVGRMSIIVAQAGVSGSTRLGKGVVLAGQVGLAGHLKVGDGARIGAQSGIMYDVPAGEEWFGYPARPVAEYFRAVAVFYRLPELHRRLRKLERAASTEPSSGD